MAQNILKVGLKLIKNQVPNLDQAKITSFAKNLHLDEIKVIPDDLLSPCIIAYLTIRAIKIVNLLKLVISHHAKKIGLTLLS